MNWWRFITNNFTVKLFSLAVAALFWFSVAAEKETIKDFSVPLQVTNIPPGLTIAGSIPKSIEVTLSGPRILFLMDPFRKKPVTLDLHNTGKGPVAFPDLRKFLDLPKGVQTIRVYPSKLELRLE